ncbi:xanthine dehydrogenase family protein molybdopterin-binding subunit [Halovenus marina]|uniref:xanthine dehydrogenase family protein molybdopterin-binding subunit n=1 Tax=Halovenus marina TaxID=3396621 RepID=UPI003F565268
MSSNSPPSEQSTGSQATGTQAGQRRTRNIVGTATKRVDAERKVRGEAEYGSDISRESMLHAAVLRSDVPHGQIRGVDTTDALARDGVEAALAREELQGIFDERVRYVGDVIAAVAATDRETALDALDDIAYEIDQLEPALDPTVAVRSGAPTVQENTPDYEQHRQHPVDVDNEAYVQNIDDYHADEHGDVDAAMAEADHVVEATYTTPRLAHCNLDTHCCVVEWTDETLHIETTLGNVTEAREELGDFLGLDHERVEITVPPAPSSSFGGRSLPKITFEPVAASLSLETDRPVRLEFTRKEEFLAGETRHKTEWTLTMGVSADGEIRALRTNVVADTGAYPNGVGHIVLSNGRDRVLDLYRVPNYEFEGVSVFTNNLPAGEYRGIGVTQATFAVESIVDEAAEAVGIDPVEFRRRNTLGADEPRSNGDDPVASYGADECLARGQEAFERLTTAESSADHLVGRGVGLGTHTTGSGSDRIDVTEARLTLRPDGTLLVSAAGVEIGQGSDTVMAQIAAQETGIDTESIRVERYPASEPLEDSLGAVASRSTYIIGAAVRDAGEQLEDELLARAAETLGCTVADVWVEDGSVHAPDGTLAFETLLDEELAVVGRATTHGAPPSYGAHFAEVAVDPDTGQVDVLTFVAAQDVGFAINPRMVEGQLEGATLHGIEFALCSDLRDRGGVPTNATLADYSVASPAEMPETHECVIVETNEETGPYGAKGVGTPSQPPVAPAILNAVRDAVDARLPVAPATAERVHEAMNDDTGATESREADR